MESTIKQIMSNLDFQFEEMSKSSVYLVSHFNAYMDDPACSPYIILALERACQFGADAVYFRFFDDANRPPVPQIYIYDNVLHKRSDIEYAEIHRDIWSASEIPIYFIIDRHQIKIFDGREPVVIENDRIKVSPIESVSWDSLQDFAGAMAQYNAKLFDNGQFWDKEEASQYFLNHTTVYERLLSSLKQVRAVLKKNCSLPGNTVDRVLIISMLIKYLEENGIDESGNNLASDFFLKSTGYDNLIDIIDKHRFVELLDRLAEHFNGGVFDIDAESKIQLRHTDLSFLSSFLSGTLSDGQLVLWQEYAFKYIPIELISNFYDEFLQKGGSAKKQSTTTSVYTPSFLVKLLVDECLPITGGLKKLIDISCGSGIFLVTAFKRLIQIWRYENRENGQFAIPTPEILERLLCEYVYGVDIDDTATKLTIFSLNLSLCSMLSPKQIWTELKFKDLSERNIITDDFFTFLLTSRQKFDLVLGNPPFIEYKNEQYQEYSCRLREKGMDFGIDIPRKQSALMFLDKAMEILDDKGQLCLIMPGGPLLYNHTEQFREYFFTKYNVSQIFDFTFLKNILFKNVVVGTVALFAENRKPSEEDIVHLVVKKTGSNREKLFFEFDYYDFYNVPKSTAVSGKHVWKCNLLGGPRVFEIVDRYSKQPTLGAYLKQKEQNAGWTYGEGYTLGDKTTQADFITGHHSVVDRSFHENGTWRTKIEENERFEKPRKRELYFPPHLLIKRGIGKNCFPMRFSEEYVTFKEGIIGIHCPESDTEELRVLEKYIRDNNNLLRFMIVAKSSRAGISKSIYTHHPRDFYGLPYSSHTHLSKNENIIIDDVFSYYFPYFDTENPEMDRTVSDEAVLREFGALYCEQMNRIYARDGMKYIPKKIIKGENLFVCIIEYSDSGSDVEFQHEGFDLTALINYSSENYRVKRVIRIYDHAGRIILIKPPQNRYWLKSIALRDADDTFTDIASYRHE